MLFPNYATKQRPHLKGNAVHSSEPLGKRRTRVHTRTKEVVGAILGSGETIILVIVWKRVGKLPKLVKSFLIGRELSE